MSNFVSGKNAKLKIQYQLSTGFNVNYFPPCLHEFNQDSSEVQSHLCGLIKKQKSNNSSILSKNIVHLIYMLVSFKGVCGLGTL